MVPLARSRRSAPRSGEVVDAPKSPQERQRCPPTPPSMAGVAREKSPI